MELFLTREAFLRFSIDDRLEGDTASKGDRFSLDGEFGSRPCQNILGEARILEPSKGEDADGEDSCFEKLFYLLLGKLIASVREQTYSWKAWRIPSERHWTEL